MSIITTPLVIVRDLLIVGALAFIVYVLLNFGKDSVKVHDMQAVQKQLDQNAKLIAKWAEDSNHADAQHKIDMDTVAARIAAQRTPVVIVRGGAAGTGPVPTNPGAPVSGSPPGGGTEAGSGIDIRPQINAFEFKYETALADCRAAIAKWPSP